MSRWDWEEQLTVGCVESYPWGRVGRNQASTSFPGIQAAYNDRSSAYRAGFRLKEYDEAIAILESLSELSAPALMVHYELDDLWPHCDWRRSWT